jgi:hypothetical protein
MMLTAPASLSALEHTAWLRSRRRSVVARSIGHATTVRSERDEDDGDRAWAELVMSLPAAYPQYRGLDLEAVTAAVRADRLKAKRPPPAPSEVPPPPNYLLYDS